MCQPPDTQSTCSREVTDTKNLLKIRESKREICSENMAPLEMELLALRVRQLFGLPTPSAYQAVQGVMDPKQV